MMNTVISTKMLSMILILVLYQIFIYEVRASTEISLVFDAKAIDLYRPCSKQGYDYFDPTLHSCGRCGAAKVPVFDSGSLSVYGDATSCTCDAGYSKVFKDCSSIIDGNCMNFNCTSCISLGMVASHDRSQCMSCDFNTTLGIGSDKDCTCLDNYNMALVEFDSVGNRLPTKKCEDCPVGTAVIASDQWIAGVFYTASRYTCQRCPDPLMTMVVTTTPNGVQYDCTCPPAYTLVGESLIGPQSCILTSYVQSLLSAKQSAYIMKYDSLTLQSLTISHYFLRALGRCLHYSGTDDDASCQTLANLCVLQLYDTSKSICSQYRSIIQTRSDQNSFDVSGWSQTLPFLYYGSSASDVCMDKSLGIRVSLGNFVINYILAAYHINGTFAGYRQLDSTFAYCGRDAPYSGSGGGDSSRTNWQVFGTSRKQQLTCQLSRLIDQEPLIYEMFAHDTESDKYYPVPVRVIGAASSTLYPAFLCDGSDVLVRRFFLWDSFTGVTSTSEKINEQTSRQKLMPMVVRYASNIVLSVNLVPGASGGAIYSPVLTVAYKDSAIPSTITADSAAPTADYFIEMRYSMDTAEYFSTLNGFFGGALVIFCLLVILRYYNWSTRQTRPITAATTQLNNGFAWSTLFEIILIAGHSYVMVFFPFFLLTCWFYFVVFKLQDIPAYMMPPMDDMMASNSPYRPFVLNLYLLSIAQIVHMVVTIWRQSQSHVIFLDWEPGKDGLAHQFSGSNAGPANTSVSVWRTIHIAREWIRLQTSRKSNLHLTLILTLAVLIGADLQYDALQQAKLHDTSDEGNVENYNVVLRFAISSWWLIFFSVVQYLFNFLFNQRFLSEVPEHAFIDLCTIAKISLIILDESFHGYYLHCRSPHQFADCTMIELVELLHREESGMTSDRSMEGFSGDIQSFEMFLSAEFKDQFDKYNSVVNRVNLIYDNYWFAWYNYWNSWWHYCCGYNNMGMPGNGNMGMGNMNRGFNNNNNNNNNNINNNVNNMNRGNQNAANNRTGYLPLNGLNLKNHFNAPIPSDQVMASWRELTHFLRQFVDNNLSSFGLQRTVMESSYIQHVFRLAPIMTQLNMPSIFVCDHHMRYAELLFLGIEMDLLIMDIIIFGLVDFAARNFIVAATATFLVDFVRAELRRSLGKTQLSGKSMIDERFLM